MKSLKELMLAIIFIGLLISLVGIFSPKLKEQRADIMLMLRMEPS